VVRSQLGQIVQETLSQKHQSQKRAGGVAQGVGPEFKYYRTKKTFTKVWLFRLEVHRFINVKVKQEKPRLVSGHLARG
jgi:hypothetical protein